MAEIAALPTNGHTVASTFSGCGGSCLGYRMAGYRVAWANEFVPAAQESYRANAAPGSILDTRDIRDVQPAEVLDACGLDAGELDLFDGSPPCDSFSTSGRREAKWGQRKSTSGIMQRTDDLFYEYTRLLTGLRPKVFVAENVSGLVKGTAKGHFLRILAALRGCGYRVEARLLDASWLGVPQQRKRLIFIGVRDDLPPGVAPVFPTPLSYQYAVRDALPDLAPGARIDTALCPAHTREWQAMVRSHLRKSERIINMTRAMPDRPSPTVLASAGQQAGVTHPFEPRRFTIAELRRIGSFPDDFVLTGSFAEQWERVGNSVPPVMMSHIASVIRDQVLAKLP